MTKYILNLRFQPVISKEEWDGVCVVLKSVYPDIAWAGGRDINKQFSPYTTTLAVEESSLNGDYILARSGSALNGGEYGLPEHIDGRQWVKDHTIDTDDIFRQLYESESSYQPKLNLNFNPPITDEDEYWRVINLIDMVYPGLRWYSGKRVTESNMFPMSNEIHNLTIGWFPEEPDRLTYTSIPPKKGESYIYQDGRQWMEYYINTNTDDVFTKLYESEGSYRPKLSLVFTPPISTEEEFNRVVEMIASTHPETEWCGGEDIREYNPFIDEMAEYDDEDEHLKIYLLTVGYFSYRPDCLTYSAWGDDNEWSKISINGREWVESKKIDVDDVFNRLYESEDEFEWAKEYLSSVGDRIDFIPPVGTKVKVIFGSSNNPDPNGEKSEHEGIVAKINTEDNDNKGFIFLFNNEDWQSDVGWNCRQEELGSNFRCWWANPGHDEIYLSNHKQHRGPDMLSGVRIRESEDEFDWAREIIDRTINLPSPDNKHHLILFKRPLSIEEVDNLVKMLYSLGWSFSTTSFLGQVKTIADYSNDSNAYIVLKPSGGMAYGSSKISFEEANKVSWASTPKIYYQP